MGDPIIAGTKESLKNIVSVESARNMARFVGTEVPAYYGDPSGKPQPDYTGIPTLSAGQLVATQRFQMMESATAWQEFVVLDRRVRVFCPFEKRIIKFIQSPLTLGADHLTQGIHGTGLGYVDLPRGVWMLNTPIIRAEGTKVQFAYQDAAMSNVYEVGSSIGLSIVDADEKNFVANVPDAEDTELTVGSNAFDATKPALMCRLTTGSVVRYVLQALEISLADAAPAVVKYALLFDTEDRFSAGGTTITPKNKNLGADLASQFAGVLSNPTATAAGATHRIICAGVMVGADGAYLMLGPEVLAKCILQARAASAGTLLLYVWDSAGAAAAKIKAALHWGEFY